MRSGSSIGCGHRPYRRLAAWPPSSTPRSTATSTARPISEDIDSLEDRILDGKGNTVLLREVLNLKRQLLELRRVLGPMRDFANALLRREVEILDDEALPYYQDLYDHLVRVLDSLDLYRDLRQPRSTPTSRSRPTT